MKSWQCNLDTPRVRLRGVPGGGDQLAEHLEEVFDRVRVSRAEGWERVCELHPRRRTPRIVTPERCLSVDDPRLIRYSRRATVRTWADLTRDGSVMCALRFRFYQLIEFVRFCNSLSQNAPYENV